MATKYSIDCLVAGLPRSGTSLVSNLLTVPEERRVCLREPRLGKKRPYREAKVEAFREFGFDGPPTSAALLEFLARQERSGVKEVRASSIFHAWTKLHPKKVLLVVRDPRTCLLSYEAKRARTLTRSGEVRRTPIGTLVWTARLLRWMRRTESPERLFTLHYERFVVDADYRDEIARWLDWPLTGHVSRGLLQDRRSNEVEQHGASISGSSLGRWERASEEERARVAPYLKRLRSFRTAFGYE